MRRLVSPGGIELSYAVSGEGPPLVLVHGAFSDHHTNWEFVEPLLRDAFTMYALARRGRGETDATSGHGLEDEARDVAALVEHVGEPVFLLGHSYGALCALTASLLVPDRIRKLVFYEGARPSILTTEAMARLEGLAAQSAWDDFARTFFRDTILVPESELAAVRATDLWRPIVSDAPVSLGDLRALHRFAFEPARYAGLAMPVLLQIGSESPRDLYVTDALAAVLPDARIEVLEGQAHEGMTTAPEQYARAVRAFLLG